MGGLGPETEKRILPRIAEGGWKVVTFNANEAKCDTVDCKLQTYFVITIMSELYRKKH